MAACGMRTSRSPRAARADPGQGGVFPGLCKGSCRGMQPLLLPARPAGPPPLRRAESTHTPRERHHCHPGTVILCHRGCLLHQSPSLELLHSPSEPRLLTDRVGLRRAASHPEESCPKPPERSPSAKANPPGNPQQGRDTPPSSPQGSVTQNASTSSRGAPSQGHSKARSGFAGVGKVLQPLWKGSGQDPSPRPSHLPSGTLQDTGEHLSPRKP